jgi:hypothetical protein
MMLPMHTLTLFIWLTLNNLVLDGIKLFAVNSVAIGIWPMPLIVQLLYINTIQQPTISGQHGWLPRYGNMGLTNGSIVMNVHECNYNRTRAICGLPRNVDEE